MAKSVKALITPELLRWARREARLTIPFVATKMKITTTKLESWENGTEQPSISQVKKLAILYHQLFTLFYLDIANMPAETNISFQDYRRFPDGSPSHLSAKLWFDIKEALRQREILLDLLNELKLDVNKFDIKYNSNITALANAVRVYFDINTPQKFKTKEDAFKYYRNKLEEKGIIVMQLSDIEMREARGLSIYFDELPIMLINRKDSAAGRIFTMFHELAHLILRRNSISLVPSDSSEQDEIECNQIAGEILVPNIAITQNQIIQSNIGKDWTDDILKKISQDFGVSREVILRRLLAFDYITNAYYSQRRAQLLAEYQRDEIEKARKAKENKIIIMPDINYVSKVGRLIPQVIISALHSNLITLADAARYSNLQPKFLMKVESAIWR